MCTGIRSLVGSRRQSPQPPSSALPPATSSTSLYLYIFRGEPAITGFDWHFTPNLRSSQLFSTSKGSGLLRQDGRLALSKVSSPSFGSSNCYLTPYSDSLSLWFQKKLP